MTREEAIEVIRKEYACVDADCDIERSCGKCELHMPSKEPILKAYEMAIKALSQEPCDDAISREAVIKGIEELKKSPWATANRGHGYEYLITEALDVVKDLCVKALPSVTQKSETVTEFADRCRECGAKYGKLLEQKSGKWITLENRFELGNRVKCSECGQVFVTGDSVSRKYCPNCGCRMVEPQESEE